LWRSSTREDRTMANKKTAIRRFKRAMQTPRPYPAMREAPADRDCGVRVILVYAGKMPTDDEAAAAAADLIAAHKARQSAERPWLTRMLRVVGGGNDQ